MLENGQIHVFSALINAFTNASYVLGIAASRDGGLWVAGDGHIRKWKDGQWVEDLAEVPWGNVPLTRLMETRRAARWWRAPRTTPFTWSFLTT